jgi:uncharacterized surface protein with fasciclin (FAS1) repeats
MLKTRLMTAAAAVAMFAAPAAFAQEAPATEAAPVATATQDGSVVAVLRADGRFTTLLSALDAAELTAVLEAQPAVSIFAPTDEAFAALPEAERTRLLDPANRQELRDLLLYHVIAADVQSSQITGARGGVPTASNGAQVLLDGTGDAIRIDGATVVQADIDASNGAIFAIDQVLSPSNSQAGMGDEEPMTSAEPATPAETVTPQAEEAVPEQPMAEGQEQSPATAEPTSDDGVTEAAPPAGESEDGTPTEPEA